MGKNIAANYMSFQSTFFTHASYKGNIPNIVRETRDPFFFSISDPAVITNPGIETFNTKSGDIVSFLCLGDGNPTPTTSWTMRDGVIDWTSVNDPRNVTLVVKAYSSGWYLCTVENKMNAAFKWFRLGK